MLLVVEDGQGQVVSKTNLALAALSCGSAEAADTTNASALVGSQTSDCEKAKFAQCVEEMKLDQAVCQKKVEAR